MYKLCVEGKASGMTMWTILMGECHHYARSHGDQPGAEVIKLFSYSSQLSMKFKMLIDIKIAKNRWNLFV